MAAVVALGWWGYKQGQEIEAGFKDPVKRAERTRAVLPYDELPAGYHPLGAISIPFLMDMVMFSDREPRPEMEEGREFDQRGFFFIKVRQFGKGDEDLEKFLKGEREEPPGLEGTKLDFESRETVATGTVEAGGGKLRYQARRGSLHAEQGNAEGIANRAGSRRGGPAGLALDAVWSIMPRSNRSHSTAVAVVCSNDLKLAVL
jgi:hypothetical protein